MHCPWTEKWIVLPTDAEYLMIYKQLMDDIEIMTDLK